MESKKRKWRLFQTTTLAMQVRTAILNRRLSKILKPASSPAHSSTPMSQVPGLIEVGSEAWREEFELADDIKHWQKK